MLSLSAEARRDIKNIQDFIADEKENPQTALKVIEKILDKIENLLRLPGIGTLLSSKVNFQTNYRYVKAAGYLIFHRHEENQIFVDRIIHGKRNYIAVLFPGSEESRSR
jgi:plasmid stabilization system protein ParE